MKRGQFTLLEPNEFFLWVQQHIILRQIEKIQQHHTWNPGYEDFFNNNHFELQEAMKDAHLERGFSDIGQHFSIFPDGKICTGRPLNQIPAGIKGANTHAICIENVGNFDEGRNEMWPEQRDSIIDITAALLMRLEISANTNGIIYHHWYDLDTGERTDGSGTTKNCPGTNFFGGNTVQSCKDSFIPLITLRMESLEIDTASGGALILNHGLIIADSLNVRSGPSSQYSIVEVLHRTVQVNCYEIQERWWRIHPTEDLWVYSKYVTEV